MIENYTGRVIVIGDARTGKSSLMRRYFSNEFKRDETSTIGVDFRMINKIIDNKYHIKLQVWDTAGQERFNSIIEHFFRDTTCVVLVYDITNKISLESVERWVEKVRNVDEPGMLYLIGNKSDLDKFREISLEDGAKLAQKIGARYFETSAKSNIDSCVNRMFDAIVADVYNIIKYNSEQLDKYHIKKSDPRSHGIPVQSYVREKSKKCCTIM